MLLRVLGPLQLEEGDREVTVGGRQARKVLARLALVERAVVSIEVLVEAAWGEEPPPSARHTVATYVLRLRKAGLAIQTASDGYRLETPTDRRDFERFLAEARAAAEGEPQRAVISFRIALEFWRSRPFPELDDVAEASIEVARLEELAESAREDLLALEMMAAPGGQQVGGARQLVAEQPYRERRWELLMLAMYRAGRQAESLEVYAEARRLLIDDLGLEPGPGLRRMQQAVLAQDPELDSPGDFASRASSRVGFPGTATRLIGRSQERGDLEEVWDRARLATLYGPAGAGKSRLALEEARRSGAPVWYVALEQIPAEQSVAAAVLDVVAPSSRAAEASDGVLKALGGADGLLVLDGCERRLHEVAGMAEAVVAGCPLVRVLVTSRERLGLIDEALVTVGPLRENEALEMLVDRARLVQPRFALDPGDYEAAGRLCQLVDCLPLGLELVARHLRLMRVRDLAETVEADLRRWVGEPAGGRRGLWAALDTSTERLSSEESEALIALAVMVADADIALVARVAGAQTHDQDVFDTVARLVDASLVQVRGASGTIRYELMRTVTVHTLETADQRRVDEARDRYHATVLTRAGQLAKELVTAERSVTVRRLDLEMPHFRAVLGEVCAKGDRALATKALRTAVALSDYWLGRHPAEGLEWLGRLIGACDPPSDLRAEAQLRRGHLAYWLTQFSDAITIVTEARELFADLGDQLGEGRALRRLGAIAAATDDMVAARGFLDASLDKLEKSGVDSETGTTLLHLGSLLADEGIVAAAFVALDRALSIATAGGDPLARGHALAALTLTHWKAGDLKAATKTGSEALNLFRDLAHRPTEGTVAYRLAAVARGLGHSRASRRYALVAMEAGKQSNTRTTVSLAHINLARLDLDEDNLTSAANHLYQALEVLDPSADRWVLVEALEASARLLVAGDRAGAGPLLDCAAAIRCDIHQPVAPTEADDLDATRTRILISAKGHSAAPLPVGDLATVHSRAMQLVDETRAVDSAYSPGRRPGTRKPLSS